jgi:two-component system sensor histidine kinase DegS
MKLVRRVARHESTSPATPDRASKLAVVKPYTRSKMVRGTLGDERQVDFDGLYADAKQTLSSTANRLRATTQRFREAYSARYEAWQHLRDQSASASLQQEAERLSDGLARARSSLARLELATEDLERSWLFLERGRSGTSIDEAAHAEPDPVGPQSLRMHILEAQESERSRLAEDLHDGPAQALANSLFQIEIIHRSLKLDPGSTEAEVRSLQALLERELDAVRDYISQLRPALLEDGDLEAALRDSVSQLEAAGIIVEADLAAPDDILDGPRRTVALRIAQEAMRNARKHSGAKHVWLSTRHTDAERPTWMLEVRDDGRGFDPQEARGRGSRRHFGLRFMRERADLIGARLEIEPDPSSGTLVRLTVEDTERSQ